MERVFGSNHPDPGEIERAKKVLNVRSIRFNCSLTFYSVPFLIKLLIYSIQDHEQSLIDAINRLGDMSDVGSGKFYFNLAYAFSSYLFPIVIHNTS